MLSTVSVTSPLAALQSAVLEYYQAKHYTMPQAIFQMLSCVEDALLHPDDPGYIELMHALFSIVVEEYVLWKV